MKTLNYIVHRPGKEGEKLNRELFGDLEESIRKEDAYGRLVAGQGMTFFHLKLNFHPEREDTRKDLNLRDITRQSIMALEERLQRPIRFLAVEHNDHTDLRHIHAIMLVKLRRGERIGIEDWKVCREKATEQAALQRRALDAVMRVQKDRQQGKAHHALTSSFLQHAESRTTHSKYRFQRVLYLSHPCPKCDGVNKQSLKTLQKRSEMVSDSRGYQGGAPEDYTGASARVRVMKNFYYNLSIVQSRLSSHFASEKSFGNERFALAHEIAHLSLKHRMITASF